MVGRTFFYTTRPNGHHTWVHAQRQRLQPWRVSRREGREFNFTGIEFIANTHTSAQFVHHLRLAFPQLNRVEPQSASRNAG